MIAAPALTLPSSMMTIHRTTPGSYAPPAGPIRPLTEQQERVVELLCEGRGTHAIARQLGISVSTVKGHLRSIDNLLTGPHDPEVSMRERVRIWALFRRWEAEMRERIMQQMEEEQRRRHATSAPQ